MNQNRLMIVLGVVAALFGLVYASVFVVNERQQAIVVRFGQIQNVHSEPGLYFKLPFAFMDADRVQYVEDLALRFDLDNIRVQDSGGAFYEVNAFVIYRISDPRRFRETVSGDRNTAEMRLRTRLDSSLRRVYGLRSIAAVLADSRTTMMAEVRNDLANDANTLGLSLEDVRISRTDLSAEVSERTYNRMRAERLAEAEFLRAQGTEEGQRRRAVADRQVVELVAGAQRDAEILRGEGDADRNRIFGEAFQRDPSFFEFYRSMSAYSASLSSPDTTLVLSPDSQFFRYFGNSNGPSAAPAAPAAPPSN
ncbi:protease modulator HflC [Rhizobiaceae bacterium BDR2-2]|uniref:Protein HflC n=1 Tax=Ectorhizobium quercum TaxID=2965071 RepID=A0AAE3MXR4_9HYPH|nr:protease modulator HflC [Ectorhizobium quercum]MCX8996416.1 protease modulator HflC [Ectorhizobium quercum]